MASLFTPLRRAMRHWPYAAVVALALLPYARLPANPLLHDAPMAVERNAVVQSAGWAELWQVDFWGVPFDAPHASGSYRPLVSLTWALQVRLTAASPAALHVADLLLHALGAVLVFTLAGRFCAGRTWALAGAALYAVHPLHTDAVASIVGRADLMAAVGLLGALVLRDAAADRAPRGRLLEPLAVACVAAALLCKEYAVAFPLIVAAYDVAQGRGRSRRAHAVWASMAAAVAAYLVARYVLIGSLGGVRMLTAVDHPLFDAATGVRWAMAARLALLAAQLLVWPTPLNHFYRWGTLPIVEGFSDPLAIAGVALLAVATIAALALHRHRKAAAPLVGMALFSLPLLPSLNTVTLSGVVFAERFMVLPVAGFAVVLAWGLDATVRRLPRGRPLAVAALVVIVALFGYGTSRRVADWSSAERLARSSLRGYPSGAEVWEELGVALAGQGRHAEAVEALDRSVRLRPGAPRTWMNYAVSLGRMGRHDEAAAAWRRTVELSPPEIAPLWRGLGNAELAAGNLGAAVAALARAVELAPGDTAGRAALGGAWLRRAETLAIAGQPAEAVSAAGAAVASRGLGAEGLMRAATVAAAAGGAAEAAAWAAEAAAVDPDLLSRRHAAAQAAEAAGRLDEAIRLYREILLARPEHFATLANLGRALVLAGRPAEAVAPLRHALALQPDPRVERLLQTIEAGR